MRMDGGEGAKSVERGEERALRPLDAGTLPHSRRRVRRRDGTGLKWVW